MPSPARPRKTRTPTRKSAAHSSAEIAILSDIHSNRHALEAVLAECDRRGVTRFCCLGDIVGYGAFPTDCVRLIRSLGCPTVIGNHDHCVFTGEIDERVSELARVGMEYSIKQLNLSGRRWLEKLPEVIVQENFTLVHASLDGPLDWEYIRVASEAAPTLRRQTTPLCFYGHTHLPKIFVGDLSPPPQPARNGKCRFHRDGRALLNPGSVGQPGGATRVPNSPSSIHRSSRWSSWRLSTTSRPPRTRSWRPVCLPSSRRG